MSQQSQQPDTLDLALRLMDDDRTALAEVLRLFGQPVIAFLVAKHEKFNVQDAEDILAISINKLWDARHNYDESKGSLKTLFFQIAKNTALDVFKCGWAVARELPIDFGDDNDVNLLEEITRPEENKRQRKDREKKHEKEIKDLKTIIAGLPAKQEAIIMSDIYARDRVTESKVLADELGIAVGYVPVLRCRAWKTIRSKMSQLGYKLPSEGDTDGQR